MTPLDSAAPINPEAGNVEIQLAILGIDAGISLIKALAARHGMTPEQILVHAEQGQAENMAELKALLAA
jgi:hypothetical protein